MSRPQSAGIAILALLAAGCVMPQPHAAREVLDEKTGTTVVAMGSALEFYASRPEVGLQAASFAHLGAMEVNRMGERRLLLWLSVLAGSAAEQQNAVGSPTGLTIVAGSNEFQPGFVSRSPKDIGLSRTPFRRPADWANDAYFDIAVEQLRELQSAEPLALVVSFGEGRSQKYELWKPERDSLARFLESL
jgi:hypothetical protein